jgi:hypothetical protein
VVAGVLAGVLAGRLEVPPLEVAEELVTWPPAGAVVAVLDGVGLGVGVVGDGVGFVGEVLGLGLGFLLGVGVGLIRVVGDGSTPPVPPGPALVDVPAKTPGPVAPAVGVTPGPREVLSTVGLVPPSGPLTMGAGLLLDPGAVAEGVVPTLRLTPPPCVPCAPVPKATTDASAAASTTPEAAAAAFRRVTR